MHRVRTKRRAIVGIVATSMAMMPALTIADEVHVRVHDKRVWARFDGTPAGDAIAAIQRATGVDVVLPTPSAHPTLTLSADAMPIEQFLRRVLQSFDLGGFALVYNGDGHLDQLIVAEKGQAVSAAPLPATHTLAPSGTAPVPLLIRSSEAASMNLGAPGQMIVVQSRPFATTRTTQCSGRADEYPVQTVLITDAAKTHVTSIVVCTPTGLSPGERLVPGLAPATTSGDRVRFLGNR